MMMAEGFPGHDVIAAAARAGMLVRKNKSLVVTDEAPDQISKKTRVVLQTAPAPEPGVFGGGGYDDYKKLARIGSGTYGVVYRAQDVRTSEVVAMKCLLPDGGGGGEDAFRREVDALEACRGLPGVVQMRNYGRRGGGGGEAFIVMELAGKNLYRLMIDVENGGLKRHTEAEVRRLTRQLLAGAAGMHGVGLMHRDLKPNNVLVDGQGGLKICDLGMARRTASAGEPPPFSNPVAALMYRAPELLLGSTDYDERVDTWAIGCLMAELLTGEHLFNKGSDEEQQLGIVLDILGTDDICSWRGYDGPLPEGCGPASRLRELFPCPEEAAKTGEPALSEAGFELLGLLLRCNPDLRLKPARALQHRWFQEE